MGPLPATRQVGGYSTANGQRARMALFVSASILLFCAIGVYTLNNSPFEVGLMAMFGLLGYALLKFGCEPAPMLLGFILGPLMEENLRRAMLLSRGNPITFVERPLSAALLAGAAFLLTLVVLPQFRKTREEAFQED